MENKHLIAARIFCTSHNLEVSFLDEMQECGLIEITRVDEEYFIPHEQLPDLEKMVRLHNELGINMEGIDVIQHLLNRMKTMQDEIRQLKNRLGIYEME